MRAGDSWRKLALALLCVAVTLLGAPLRAQFSPAGRATPEIDAPVTDQVGVMIDSDAVADRLRAYRQQHGLQMAVLIVRSTAGEPIEDYALRVATQ